MDDDVEELFHLLRTQTPLDDYRSRSLARWTVACGLPWEKALRIASSGVTGLIVTKFMDEWDREQELRLQAAVMNAMMSAYIMTDEIDHYKREREDFVLSPFPDVATDRFEVELHGWSDGVGRILRAAGWHHNDAVAIGPSRHGKSANLLDNPSFERGTAGWAGPGIGWVTIDMSQPDYAEKLRAAQGDPDIEGITIDFMNVQNGTVFEPSVNAISALSAALLKTGEKMDRMASVMPDLPPMAYHDKFNGHPRSPKASRNARKRGKR